MHLGGNIAFNRSKVLDLGGDKEFFVNGVNTSLPTFIPGGIVRVGEPLGNFFGYIWDGIFQTAAEATASGQSGAVAGGMKLRDVNGDGKITTDDRVILGNGQPKYTFGQNGSVGYRAFSLHVPAARRAGQQGRQPEPAGNGNAGRRDQHAPQHAELLDARAAASTT